MAHPFITKIQSSDEKTKKRWLIIFSSIASLVVLGVWVVNLSLIFGSKDTTENTQTSLQEPSGISTSWNTFTSSVYSASQSFREALGESFTSLKTGLSQPREVEITAE